MTGHPAAVLRPADPAGVREAVLDTSGPLAISGACTAADWAGTLGPVESVLDTTGLTGVIQHNPGDMTVSVRAGTPLRALADELAPHGQHVAFDAARVADGATVGGLVATADAGPSALVYGSLRDLVIGTTLVLADGTVAHSGGHVIKNVAGYDLTKLVHGSYGTLAVIVEVVLRLHPVPARTATVTVPCTLAEAAVLAAKVLDGPHEPVALEWVADNEDGHLLIRIEGTGSALDAREHRLTALLGNSAELRERPVRTDLLHERAVRADPEGVRGPAGGWRRHAALVRGAPGLASLRIGARPSVLPRLLDGLPCASVTAGLGTGVATVSVDPGAVAEAHAAVHAAGGTSVLRRRPPGTEAPAWGPPPSALQVLRAVSAELDPLHRLGPGRFAPWM